MTAGKPLAGRLHLVTGASRGLGRAMAMALAGAGAKLVLVARTVGALEELDDAQQALSGEPAVLVPLDLTDLDAIDRLGGSLYQRFGRLDGLFAAAAGDAEMAVRLLAASASHASRIGQVINAPDEARKTTAIDALRAALGQTAFDAAWQAGQLLTLDDAFADVVRDAQGRSWARLQGVDGRTAALWADENFGYWQVYSADRLPEPMARRAMAIEPMTAAPNAFNTGDGLVRLGPGESFTAVWGATLL